jgi:hypothetical protein
MKCVLSLRLQLSNHSVTKVDYDWQVLILNLLPPSILLLKHLVREKFNSHLAIYKLIEENKRPSFTEVATCLHGMLREAKVNL